MNEQTPTIYLITSYEFNHGSQRKHRYPLDKRFLQSDKNYVYYLIDKEIPEVLKDKQVISEYQLDPQLHKAGGTFFGEWSFLLAEEKHAFCTYPFFMISSRFYEKNHWLYRNLDQEWDSIFSYLNQYGWGYLPSYDRSMRWIDLSWEKKVKKEYWKHTFFPFTPNTYSLIQDQFGVQIPKDYRYTADLFCNYIGFRSRKELLEYTSFYRPVIDHFFTSDYTVKTPLSPFIKRTNMFRNEKPFTFLLELICHLFFFKTQNNYFALHYDGYYSVDEYRKIFTRLESFPIPLKTQLSRKIGWEWKRLNTEGSLSILRRHLSPYKQKLLRFLEQTNKGKSV